MLARAHLVDAGYLAPVCPDCPARVGHGYRVRQSTIDRYAPFLVLSRLPLVPRVVVVGVILVGIDAMNWLAHVANHRSLALWRLHALHHSQEDMSVFTTFRTHPLAHASYLLALLPALVLGASGTVPAAALIVLRLPRDAAPRQPPVDLRSAGPDPRESRPTTVCTTPALRSTAGSRSTSGSSWSAGTGWPAAPSIPTGGAPIRTGIGGRPVPIEQSGAALRARPGGSWPSWCSRSGERRDGRPVMIDAQPTRVPATLYEQVRATKTRLLTRDVALLGARIALAWIFIYHGAGTLFGAFGGAGIDQASIFYGTVAHLHPATFFAVLGGIIELFGGDRRRPGHLRPDRGRWVWSATWSWPWRP